jgi:hypothetical protein
VNICTLYGDGFYYIPGTDTCLKLGGYLRIQADYNMGNGAAVGTDEFEQGQARFTRDLTNDVNYLVRAALSWDIRQQTEYGPLRTYARFGTEVTTPPVSGGGSTPRPYWERAFLQFAGFTIGRARSFFDIFTYFGTFSYANVRVQGDTDRTGQNLWAYTAEFGDGFSTTLSLEDPATHKAFTFDATAPNFFGLNGGAIPDNAFTDNGGGSPTSFGLRVPDIVGNLRVDRTWGFAGVSVALHDASGAYYATPNETVNGHPAETYGWAAAAGANFNLPGGDAIGANFAYGEGATGFVASAACNASAQLYNSNTSVGVGWLSDGVFATGTGIELTRAWSLAAAYEHVWNSRWRTCGTAATPVSTITAPPPASSTRRSRPARSALGRSRGWSATSRLSPRLPATVAIPTTASIRSARARSGTRLRASISVWTLPTRDSTPRTKVLASMP